MKFKSQICTSRSQSEKLLALGLKKETADMVHCAYSVDSGMAIRPFRWLSFSEVDMENFIPAWSLHRLLEMLYADIGECMIFFPNTYEEIISDIETMIRRGTFNKDYLEEQL